MPTTRMPTTTRLLFVFGLALVFSAFAPVRAQHGLDVHLCLEDDDTGQPLAGAAVSAHIGQGTPAEATTTSDGCAWLSVVATTVGNEETTPSGFAVGPVSPNPATSRAQVALTVDRAQPATWRLYDTLGRLVRGPEALALAPGSQAVEIPLDGLPSGRYFFQFAGAEQVLTQPLIKTNGASATQAAAIVPTMANVEAATLVTFEAQAPGYEPITIEREVTNNQTLVLGLIVASTDARPLTDMAPGETYLGFEGGLYPGGQNVAPTSHYNEGVALARSIEPLDANGNPDPNGKIVMMSLGMSNVTQEWCNAMSDPQLGCGSWTFMGQAESDATLNTAPNGGPLVIVNGARGGQASEEWDSPDSPEYTRVEQMVFPYFNVTAQQVQVIWLKGALSRSYFGSTDRLSLPNPGADAYSTEHVLGDLLRTLRIKYPNLKQVFMSSRIYGGYANAMSNSPEPFAYEGGFGVKWAIEAQITQRSGGSVDAEAGDLSENAAPWAAWGPYLWAPGQGDGTPRSDGLVWLNSYIQSDGIHPNAQGEEIVADLLMDFFKTSPYTRCWFLANGPACGN